MINDSSIEQDPQYGAMLVRTVINGGFVNHAEMAIKIVELMLSYAHNP